MQEVITLVGVRRLLGASISASADAEPRRGLRPDLRSAPSSSSRDRCRPENVARDGSARSCVNPSRETAIDGTRPASARGAAASAAVLLLAAVLRLWRLEDNGFGTDYYAAGVRSMLQGGALFFYNSFDPAGFISLDKPPVAFWIQAAFAAVLGFSGWTIHLPQALAGVASVALLYRLVRRPFGVAAATHRRPAAGPHAGRGRDRPLQQHQFLAGLLPAAGGLGGAARPRPVAGRWRWRCWASPSTSRCWRRWSAARRCWPAGGRPARSTGAGGSAGWRRPA